MKSGNPTLNEKAFDITAGDTEGHMTQSGTYTKLSMLLFICITTAFYTFTPQGAAYMMPAMLGGFALALVTIFKKKWAMITAPLYAICEGALLGGISYMYHVQYGGIVFNAVILTFGVFGVMLFLFGSKIIVVTQKLKMMIFAATGAIALLYLVSFIMGFFGGSIPMIHSTGPMGIGFSLVVVGIAAFNLLLDFDFIEKAAARGNTPKYMEWYGAFSLLVTLVWLYLEILRLLSKLQSRD